MKKLEELEAPEALKVLELRYKPKESVYDKGLINIIEEALKRNEPMKINEDAPQFICPKCEMQVNYYNVNFCPNCGQKLEWSE